MKKRDFFATDIPIIEKNSIFATDFRPRNIETQTNEQKTLTNNMYLTKEKKAEIAAQ